MADFEKLVAEIEKLTVPEIAEFVKLLEARWGVSAAAPVAIAGMPVAVGMAIDVLQMDMLELVAGRRDEREPRADSEVHRRPRADLAEGLSDEQKAQVMELRAKGQQLHEAGQHQESVDTLAQAKQILGI